MRPKTSNQLTAFLFITAFCVSLATGGRAQTLVHRYSFNEPAGSQSFADSVGGPAWAGDIVTNGGSPELTGDGLFLSGEGDYASLPAGIMSNYTQITVEFWVDSAINPNWTRVFSFGSQNGGGSKSSGVDFCPSAPGNYQNLDCSDTNGNDCYANNNTSLNGETDVHVTVVVDPVDNQEYYYNGTTVVSAQNGTVPQLSAMYNQYDLIGSSLTTVDPTFGGTIHEFRVYQGVLPAGAVALNDAAGSANYLTSPGTIVSLNFTSPVDPVAVNQSVQQTVIGNFAAVTNLNLVLYGGVTYASGNTNVLTISSSGVVKGIAVGTTTVIATYGSLSVTNTLTVVSVPTTLIHRYSFTSDASDSIGGANGTYQGDANNSGGQLVLDGGGYLSLPASMINIATNAAVTIDTWTTIGATAEWSHLWEFGNLTANNIYCAPRANLGGFNSFGISEGGYAGSQTLNWAHGWSNLTMHITCVIDPTTSTLAEYTNGVLVQASYTASAALTLVGTANFTLGNSSYGDPNAILSVDEFRIYSGALTPAQVAKSDLSGPNSTNFNPGALSSIAVPSADYPAFSRLLAPVILANYPGLTNFNLMPNIYADINGLTVTSRDTNIVNVGSGNLLTTYRPGTVTLSATYLGKTASGTIRVCNQALLTHRYSFSNDASDSVGGANGTLVGTANVSSGQVQLDGGSGDYVSLPPGLLGTYRSATLDIWATISSAQQHWSRLWEFADVGPATVNEFYFAPAWNSGANQTYISFSPPAGGANIGPLNPPTVNETVHLTTLVGDGTLDIYTNGVFWLTANITDPASQAGGSGSWIGYSPYGDPGITGSVDEYRIYQGRLSPEEIEASDALGPDATLSTSATLTATPSGSATLLSWPVANAGFAVETTGNLATGPWITLTNAPSLVGGTQWQLSVTNSPTAQFFRLIR